MTAYIKDICKNQRLGTLTNRVPSVAWRCPYGWLDCSEQRCPYGWLDCSEQVDDSQNKRYLSKPETRYATNRVPSVAWRCPYGWLDCSEQVDDSQNKRYLSKPETRYANKQSTECGVAMTAKIKDICQNQRLGTQTNRVRSVDDSQIKISVNQRLGTNKQSTECGVAVSLRMRLGTQTNRVPSVAWRCPYGWLDCSEQVDDSQNKRYLSKPETRYVSKQSTECGVAVSLRMVRKQTEYRVWRGGAASGRSVNRWTCFLEWNTCGPCRSGGRGSESSVQRVAQAVAVCLCSRKDMKTSLCLVLVHVSIGLLWVCEAGGSSTPRAPRQAPQQPPARAAAPAGFNKTAPRAGGSARTR
ncbi:hypothetical protein J6590_017532 [Homalodisca vitripennis]|nr:hypothetical protein J6590_017532 [Homalodisca vitripennis]